MIYWDRWGRASSYGRVRYSTVLVTPPALTLIDVEELKARARIDGDDENGLLLDYIRTAISKVEKDTGVALLTQTWDVIFDEWRGTWAVLSMPFKPLQSVTSIKTTDSAGAVTTWAASNYLVDTASARIALATTVAWPGDIRLFQAWTIRIVVGHTSVSLIDPQLVHAVGLLATHYATAGRDLVPVEPAYGEAIGQYSPVA